MSGQRRQSKSEPTTRRKAQRQAWPWRQPKAAPSPKTASGGPAKPPKKRFWVWTRRLLLTGFAFFVLMVVAFVVAYMNTDIPDANAEFQTETSYVYYSDGKTVLGKFATQDRDSVELDEMGTYTADAVVAAEDRSFYTNRGIDPKGILRAAFSNAKGNNMQGASTITQQYVKVLYLSQERSYKRKIKEAFLSLKLANQEGQDKDQILQGYLNTIYFGRGAYGIEAAAHAYFGIPASKLNLKQSAALAAVINSPNNYDPANGEAAKAMLFSRYGYVLDGLEQTGKVDSEQYAKASKSLPKFPKIRGNSGYVGQNGYVLQMVRDELRKKGYSDAEIDGSGLRITTTIDKKVMDAAAAAAAEQRPEGLPQLHIAIASVDPKTGGLKGIYAGAPYEKTNGGTNWALSGQAPGSTFKPFALATGLENGYSLKSTFDGNSPLEVGGIDFNNQGDGPGGSFGKVNLLKATEDSINTAYVDLVDAMDDGPQKVIDTAARLGIPKRAPGLRAEAGVPLGTADIRPVDMANAYASIANGGVAKKWHLIERVGNADDQTLFQHKLRTTRALEEDVAADVSYAMQQVVKSGTAAENVGGAFDRPAAGKTGTSTTDDGDVRASWFVGFTPQLSTAVMYVRGDGNDPLNGYMPTFYGGQYPARTWTDMMSRALDGEAVEEFPPPGDVKATAKDHRPEPTRTPKPKKPTPTPTPTPTDKHTRGPKKTPTPTPTPLPTPTETCGLLNPCEPTPSPTEPTDPGGGGPPKP